MLLCSVIALVSGNLRPAFMEIAPTLNASNISTIMAITYQRDVPVDLEQFIALYQSCSLGARRPLDDRSIAQQMQQHGNLTFTAWDNDQLVGISRSLTDFGYVCYLADLAIRDSHQRLGIGLELIRLTRSALGPRAMIVLIAAPQAVDYYPTIGFTRHDSAWILKAGDPFPMPTKCG
jgi:predicted N-acetyltransferase YhbS